MQVEQNGLDGTGDSLCRLMEICLKSKLNMNKLLTKKKKREIRGLKLGRNDEKMR